MDPLPYGSPGEGAGQNFGNFPHLPNNGDVPFLPATVSSTMTATTTTITSTSTSSLYGTGFSQSVVSSIPSFPSSTSPGSASSWKLIAQVLSKVCQHVPSLAPYFSQSNVEALLNSQGLS